MSTDNIPALAPTAKDIAAMELVLAVKREQVGREATPTELIRWAIAHEGVALAMRARCAALQAEAARHQKPLAGINRPAPPKKEPKSFTLPAKVTPKGPTQTPEQVLRNRPAKPPGKGKAP